METTCLNAAEKAPDAVRKPYRRPSRSVKAQVLTHENIDGRLRARKKFDAIARGVAQDIAGNNQLSTVQLHLIEAFAGVAIHVNNLTARLLRGEDVNVLEHSQAISTMVRVAQRIGIHRLAREISTLDPLSYAEERDAL